MPRLSPFPALRYTPEAGNLEDLLAPPYDVIDSAQAAELRSRSPYNSVRVVLPEGSSADRYGEAATVLAGWREAGVLATDTEPGVYVYRQEYDQAGAPVARLALFGALDLVPLDGGDVLPHERTHAGPKRDRLALTLATMTQLSPVFMAGKDPEAELLGALRAAMESREPDAFGCTPDGIRHSLWRVVGQSAVGLCRIVNRRPLLIADGHHRYETALEAARQLGTDEAEKMLVCVVSEVDPGLVIQPTHRTLTSVPAEISESLLNRLATWFEIAPLGQLSPSDAAVVAATTPSAFVMLRNGEAHSLTPRLTAGERQADPGAAIAAVHFDRCVMRELLDTDADTAAQKGILEYHRDPEEAARRAGSRGAVFLLPAVSLEAVWKATTAGLRLPPKSTYFEPKMPSGLLYRSL
jgi:uncharacterized protein (DUF1015 family)